MTLRVGTQGWAYRAWIGPFYGGDAPPEAMLATYCQQFSSVEVHDTFFGLPPENLVKAWRDAVTPSFVFALTVPQQVTHDRRLANCADLMTRFIERARLLESRLGPLLLKMSPDFVATTDNRGIFEEFLHSLDRELHWAIEFRHPSWFDQGVLSLLRRRGIALVLADGRWMRRDRLFKMARDPTARFLYLRWMGQGHSYTDFGTVQHQREDLLEEWAELIKAIRGRFETIYGYFNNRFEGYAPHSARTFERIVRSKSEQDRPVAPAT